MVLLRQISTKLVYVTFDIGLRVFDRVLGESAAHDSASACVLALMRAEGQIRDSRLGIHRSVRYSFLKGLTSSMDILEGLYVMEENVIRCISYDWAICLMAPELRLLSISNPCVPERIKETDASPERSRVSV